MTPDGRVWKLWAYRRESGVLWHVGERPWVELHRLSLPLVPVLVEEILGEPHAPEVTHYGWRYAEGSRHRRGDVPTLIQVRTGCDPANPRRDRMFLDMCFAQGLDAAVEAGYGSMIALRITERQEDR